MVGGVTEEQIARFYADLGQRVQRARTAARVTQQQLASAAGLTRSSIANVEAGRQRVPTHVLAAMACALRVDAGDLFTPSLLTADTDRQVVTLPLLDGDPPSMRQFVEGALATVGITARWIA